MVGVYITFREIEYIGYILDAESVSGAQYTITAEVNDKEYYRLCNTKDGDIIFPKHALFLSHIKLVRIDDE